ncbi:hypothetical protein JCM8202v2_002355 [Rhodotorula sphaerocarpa]
MVVRALWLYTLQHTQFVVTGLTAYCILRIRTAHSLWFGAGSLVAAFSGAKKFDKTYGMPSTHSSSIAFFGAYLSLSSLLLPLHPRVTALLPFWDSLSSTATSALESGGPPSSVWNLFAGTGGQRATRLGLAAFFLAGSASICWSRVRLGHHTPAQVIAGASLGATIALAWMSLWLGLDGWSVLLGRDLFAMTSGVPVPSLLMRGVKGPALLWERAAEEVGLVALEAWRSRRWDKLAEVRNVPIPAWRATGEL